MKALYFFTLISCFALWRIKAAGIEFTNNYHKPDDAATQIAGTNGLMLHLKATTKYAYIISDEIEPTTTAKEWYITLICTTTAVDFGPILGTIPGGPYATGVNPLIGQTTNPFSDFLSLYYPYVPKLAATFNPTIATLGKTYRYTVTSFTDSEYFEFTIRGKLLFC